MKQSILYPVIEPYRSEFLNVSKLHTIYYEECGNPKGKPVLFIHGGPGSGTRPNHRSYFNPERYRIILVDQRGCGKSTPHAELRENSTWELIADFEKIRTLLKIDRWMLFGGSWGSTLALAYAQRHPEHISELVLRGIFLGRSKELAFMYQFGASEIFPEAWENFIAIIPENERNNMQLAYQLRLNSQNRELRYEAAHAWSVWEGSVSSLYPNEKLIETFGDPEFALALACIENYYFSNQLFLEPNQLLNNMHKIGHIPGVIVHGRYDMCCPATNAWDLHNAWPASKLHIIPDAGHSATEPGIAEQLIKTTDHIIQKGVKVD
jgi:proline iminopeptidase